MSKRDVPLGMASVQSFHPEFGYLCPSAGLKRKLRTVVKGALALALITLGATLAVSALVMPQRSQIVRTEAPAVAALPVDGPAKSPPAAALAIVDARAPASPVLAPTGSAALARAQANCDDLSASFLSAGCQPSRKSRFRRATQDARKVANAPIGHADAVPQTEPPQAAAARPARGPEVLPAAVAGTAAPAGDREASAPEKPAPRKPVKAAQKHAPGREAGPVETAVATPAPPAAPTPFAKLLDFLRPATRYANGSGTTFWQ